MILINRTVISRYPWWIRILINSRPMKNESPWSNHVIDSLAYKKKSRKYHNNCLPSNKPFSSIRSDFKRNRWNWILWMFVTKWQEMASLSSSIYFSLLLLLSAKCCPSHNFHIKCKKQFVCVLFIRPRNIEQFKRKLQCKCEYFLFR